MNRYANPVSRSAQRGFSLLEVLIAAVVLAAGLLALTALQGALMRNSADAKARSQLAALAQSVMDDARSNGYGAIPVGSGVQLSTVSDANRLTDAAKAMGAATLTENSTVTEVVNGTLNYKIVNLRLNWIDATGGARSLRLTSVISPLLLVQGPLTQLDPPESSSYRPIVRRPSPVTEGMIPIAVGNGEDTAATNPKPELIGRSNDTLVSDTRFDLLTFNGSEGLVDGFVRFDKRIETAMVGCTCQTGLTGFPTGGSAPAINTLLRDRAFRPSYWDGTRYTEPQEASYVPARSPATSAQSELCDVCCRDHEDDRTGTTGPKFNPWLASGANHDHFLDPAGSAVTSGAFREACRVIRVGGVWRVTPDPKVQDIALVPTNVHPSTTGSTTAPADNNAATSPLVSDAGKTSYIAFAYDFIKQFFYDKDTLAPADLLAMQASAGLDEPEYVPIKSGDIRWLHARAMLTDFLEDDAVDVIDRAIADCAATDVTGRAQCVLPVVPLATINTTELANWSGRETSETGITHTGTLALATTLKNYGQAMLNRFVSALALIGPINPADDDNPIKDEQTFALVSGTRTGTWLTVASPSGVLFGDATDPSRGFATISGGTRFNISLSGLPFARDNNPGNDPNVNLGISVPQPCNSTDLTRGGNPFECTSDSTTNLDVAVGAFNYLETTGGNIDDPCDGVGKIGQGQAVCKAYTLVGGTLVSGVSGRPSEVSSVNLASVTAGSTYTLVFNDVNPDRNATAVCSTTNQWIGWTCE